MTDRTIPDRDTIVRLIAEHWAVETYDDDHSERLLCVECNMLLPAEQSGPQHAADAVLAVLADQPTVAEARAQAFLDVAGEAATDIDHHGCDHDGTCDYCSRRAHVYRITHSRAARERGESR